MDFQVSEYCKLFIEHGIESANKYRIKNVPQTLYKYISLSDSDKLTEMDEKKLNQLKNKELWLSTYKSLNDSFELKAIYLNKSRLDESDWEKYYTVLEAELEDIRKTFLIGSFTTELYNLPMWAHYANNHHGICIEYKVQNKQFIYKMSYEIKRSDVTSIMTNLFNDANKESRNYEKIERVNWALFHSAMIKNKTWEYENEYRLIYQNKQSKEKGDIIALNKLGISIFNIYIGINCTLKYRQILKEIAKNNNYGLYEMYFNDQNEYFELSNKKI